MVLTSFLENELGKHAPLSDKDKMLFLEYVSTKLMVLDTVFTIDSTLINGQIQYDTTTTFEEDQRSMSRSSYSFNLLDKHLRTVQGVDKYTFYSAGFTYNIFKNNKKLILDGIYTDAAYWKVFDFKFLHGIPYTEQEVVNQAQQAVITEKAALSYFGEVSNVLNKEIIIEKKHYTVIGIVATVPTSQNAVTADVFLPYTNMPNYFFGGPQDLLGPFNAVLVAKDVAGRKIIRDDLERIGNQYIMPAPKNYNKLEIDNLTFKESYAAAIIDQETPQISLRYAKWILLSLLSLFILLPTLNLININISRILERAAEIGVRKSFGATDRQILLQFVFENVILTIIGGIIGLVLAFLAIYLINESEVLTNTQLHFNARIFFYSLLICLGFGILSGLIPAYRISKIPIVDSLKQNAM